MGSLPHPPENVRADQIDVANPADPEPISIKFFVEFLDSFGLFSIQILGAISLSNIAPEIMNRKQAQKNRKIDRNFLLR